MITSVTAWFENQSIGIQSVIIVALIMLSMTGVILFFDILITFFGNKLRKKYSEKIQKSNDKKMNEINEKNTALVERYKVHPLTRRIVDLIKNDSELLSVRLSFFDITLCYPEKEKKTDFYEWDFNSVPAGEYRQFAEAVCELLGNQYKYEMSEFTTEGTIKVLKGE